MPKRRPQKRACPINADDHLCGKCYKLVRKFVTCDSCGADFHPGCALSYIKANSARTCCAQAFANLRENKVQVQENGT